MVPRPAGGWVAGLEPDTEYALCFPPELAFERLCATVELVYPRSGADPRVGETSGPAVSQGGIDGRDGGGSRRYLPAWTFAADDPRAISSRASAHRSWRWASPTKTNSTASTPPS